MPLDGYMYLDGPGRYKVDKSYKTIGEVKGETPDVRFGAKGAFQIWYFKWECNRAMKGANRLDSSVSVGSMRVKKEIDIATPTLFLANVTGSVFRGAHVYFRKTTGTKLQTFFHAIFSDVILEKWEINLDGDDTSEEMSFSFDWVEVNYYPQTREGSRKKDNPANMKQYCTSNPQSTDVPRVFRRENKDDIQEGDLSMFNE